MSRCTLLTVFKVTSLLIPGICFSFAEKPDENEKKLNYDGLGYRDINMFFGSRVCQGTIRKEIEDAVQNICISQNKSEGSFAEQLRTVSLKMEQLENKIDNNLVKLEALEKNIEKRLYRSVQEITEKISSSCRGIAKGYVYNETGRFYYKLHTECKSWSEAREVCQSEGGDLISLNENNFEFFKRLVRTRPSVNCSNPHLWVGTTDIASEGKWYWLNGEKVSSVFWYPFQPDNGGRGDEHCGHLNAYFENKLNDEGCSEKSSFLCQIYL